MTQWFISRGLLDAYHLFLFPTTLCVSDNLPGYVWFALFFMEKVNFYILEYKPSRNENVYVLLFHICLIFLSSFLYPDANVGSSLPWSNESMKDEFLADYECCQMWP